MGCRGSKHASRGGATGARSPEARRYSVPVTRHSVALKSCTLGSLSLDRAVAAAGGEAIMKSREDGGAAKRGASPPVNALCPSPPLETRWQRQVPAKSPRTPTKTPVHEPEVINVWELMEDLDDGGGEDGHGVKRQTQSAPGSPEFNFDPDILAVFRKALGELSPARDAPDNWEDITKREIQRFPGIVRARINAFQQKIDAKIAKMTSPPTPPPPPESARKVVLYLTSLRGIRQTYEDCWSARAILHGYGVHVDERDLSMHAGYKDELRTALGTTNVNGKLPQVFADGQHLGSAEDVRRMHESGELAGVLETCEIAPGTGGKTGAVALEACGGCGGVRFMPCEVCSGSCKVFVEDDEGAGVFRRCPECNENGLVRCPLC